MRRVCVTRRNGHPTPSVRPARSAPRTALLAPPSQAPAGTTPRLLHNAIHHFAPPMRSQSLYFVRSLRLHSGSPAHRFAFSTASSEAPTKEPRSLGEAVNRWWRAAERGNADEMLDVIDEVGVDRVSEPSKRTAMHMAAARGDKDICALLLENDARIDMDDAQGATPVDLAVRSGSKDVARLLLGWQILLRGDEVLGKLLRKSYHVDPTSVQTRLLSEALPESPDDAQAEFASAVRSGDLFLVQLIWFFDARVGAKHPLLFLALQGGNRKVLEFLLDMGVDAELRSADNLSLLEVAVNTASAWALPLLHKAGVNAGLDSALLRAVASEHATAGAMVRDLLKMGASPSSTAPDGATGLHIAAIKGDEASTLALLEGGAVCDALSKQGVTPLFYAAMQGHTGVMRVLLENGADVRVHNESRCTPLFLAAHEGHADAVQLLLSFHADANALGEVAAGVNATPLFAACLNGHASAARLLIDGGADINGTADGLPPLVAALPHAAVSLLLLSRGATPNLRFPAVLLGSEDPDLQTTPLAWAARNGDAGLARLLLQHGADVNLAESTGATPMRLAQQAGHADVAQLLNIK